MSSSDSDDSRPTAARKRARALARENSEKAEFLTEQYQNPTVFTRRAIVYDEEKREIAMRALKVTDVRSLIRLLRYIAERFCVVGNTLYFFETMNEMHRYSALPPITQMVERSVDSQRASWPSVSDFIALRSTFAAPPKKNLLTLFLETAIRCHYSSVVFYPVDDVPSNQLNTYQLPRACAIDERYYNDVYTPQFFQSSEFTQSFVWLYLTYLWRDVCNSDDEMFHVVIQYFAHIFQFPAERTNRVLVFVGPQGAGKTLLIYEVLVSMVFGSHALYTTNENLILGEYNNALSSRSIVVFEEASISSRSAYDRLKGIVTADKLAINQKYHEVRTEQNFSNFIFLSNADKNGFKLGGITPDDRRIILIPCSEAVRTFSAEQKRSHWAPLFQVLDDPEAVLCLTAGLARLLQQVDLTAWRSERSTIRVLTPDFMSMAISNLAKPQQVLVRFCVWGRHAPMNFVWAPTGEYQPLYPNDSQQVQWRLEVGREELHLAVRPYFPDLRFPELLEALVNVGVQEGPSLLRFPSFDVFCRNVENALGVDLRYCADVRVLPSYHLNDPLRPRPRDSVFRCSLVKFKPLPKKRARDEDAEDEVPVPKRMIVPCELRHHPCMCNCPPKAPGSNNENESE